MNTVPVHIVLEIIFMISHELMGPGTPFLILMGSSEVIESILTKSFDYHHYGRIHIIYKGGDKIKVEKLISRCNFITRLITKYPFSTKNSLKSAKGLMFGMK